MSNILSVSPASPFTSSPLDTAVSPLEGSDPRFVEELQGAIGQQTSLSSDPLTAAQTTPPDEDAPDAEPTVDLQNLPLMPWMSVAMPANFAPAGFPVRTATDEGMAVTATSGMTATSLTASLPAVGVDAQATQSELQPVSSAMSGDELSSASSTSPSGVPAAAQPDGVQQAVSGQPGTGGSDSRLQNASTPGPAVDSHAAALQRVAATSNEAAPLPSMEQHADAGEGREPDWLAEPSQNSRMPSPPVAGIVTSATPNARSTSLAPSGLTQVAVALPLASQEQKATRQSPLAATKLVGRTPEQGHEKNPVANLVSAEVSQDAAVASADLTSENSVATEVVSPRPETTSPHSDAAALSSGWTTAGQDINATQLTSVVDREGSQANNSRTRSITPTDGSALTGSVGVLEQAVVSVTSQPSASTAGTERVQNDARQVLALNAEGKITGNADVSGQPPQAGMPAADTQQAASEAVASTSTPGADTHEPLALAQPELNARGASARDNQVKPSRGQDGDIRLADADSIAGVVDVASTQTPILLEGDAQSASPSKTKSSESTFASSFVQALMGQGHHVSAQHAQPLEVVPSPAPMAPHQVRLDAGQVQVEVVRLVKQGGGQVVMELTPPDESKFKIDLSISQQGVARLVVDGASESTRARLEQSVSGLQDQFQQMGLQLQLDMRQSQQHETRSQADLAMADNRQFNRKTTTPVMADSQPETTRPTWDQGQVYLIA